jgi:hypothetical protein
LKRKKVLAEIIVLLCLLLALDIRPIVSTFSETEETPKIQTITAQEPEDNPKCGTIILLERLNLQRHQLRSGVQSESQTVSSRPTDHGGGIDGNQHILPKLYNTTHFVIHWTNGTDGGSSTDAPLPNTDANGNQIPDVIENWGEIFEYVWNFEINVRGFPAPPSDAAEPNDIRNRNPDGRYDIFIYYFGYFGYAYPEQWPNSPSYSYIGLRNTLGSLGLRQVTAAHEFFHAIQFYYDCTEEIWWMETTAVYMEDEVYPDVNDNYQYLPKWFQNCDAYGLEYADGWHEYGNFIFAKRLSEDFGDEIIKEIWEEMANTDGLVAIGNVLASKNSTLFNEFSKFITANFFLEQMYVDGADYRTAITGKTTFNGVWLEYQYDASIAPDFVEINSSNVNRNAWMDKWATDYITLKLDPAKTKYRISFDGLDLNTNYLVKLATKKEGVINETIFQINAQKDGYVDLDYDTFENITLIIANAGNTDTSNPSWRVTIEVLSEIEVIHDIAITGLTPYETVIKQGKTTYLNVTIANQGNVSEAFEVTTYANDTLIQTKTVALESNATIEVTFDWNTTSWLEGNYTLSAYAWPVRGETETTDNTYVDGFIQIVPLIHDVAVKQISFSNPNPKINETIVIYVTVENEGEAREFLVLSLNYTLSTEQLIGVQTVRLEPGAKITLNFTWTPNSSGRYKISAYLESVSGETDLIDNTYIEYLIVNQSDNGGGNDRPPMLK